MKMCQALQQGTGDEMEEEKDEKKKKTKKIHFLPTRTSCVPNLTQKLLRKFYWLLKRGQKPGGRQAREKSTTIGFGATLSISPTGCLGS